ncbi:MAG: hypothetical protein V4487_08045 [Chlamydiota bacterium]
MARISPGSVSIGPFEMGLADARIDRLEQINGVLIAEIERRARPGAAANSGFLGAQEFLRDVLKVDSRTVDNLEDSAGGKSGVILHGMPFAKAHFTPMHTVAFRLAIGVSLVAVAAAVVFTHLALWALLPAALLMTLAFSKRQILHVSYLRNRGIQEDIFSPQLQGGWDDQLTITNLLNGAKVKVGRGVIDYIEKHGFYEGGGDQNPYRIDPARLVAILTGASVSTVRSKNHPPYDGCPCCSIPFPSWLYR